MNDNTNMIQQFKNVPLTKLISEPLTLANMANQKAVVMTKQFYEKIGFLKGNSNNMSPDVITFNANVNGTEYSVAIPLILLFSNSKPLLYNNLKTKLDIQIDGQKRNSASSTSGGENSQSADASASFSAGYLDFVNLELNASYSTSIVGSYESNLDSSNTNSNKSKISLELEASTQEQPAFFQILSDFYKRNTVPNSNDKLIVIPDNLETIQIIRNENGDTLLYIPSSIKYTDHQIVITFDDDTIIGFTSESSPRSIVLDGDPLEEIISEGSKVINFYILKKEDAISDGIGNSFEQELYIGLCTTTITIVSED